MGYLRKKGYVVDAGGHRGIRLSPAYLKERREVEGLPILGRVVVAPILAEQNVEGYLSVEKLFGWKEGTFVLRVAGDSMVDERILDGDYVVVKAGSTLEDGQIAVVPLDEEATVKRVFLRGDRIALKPANRRGGYSTRYIRASEKNVRILGKVIGCIRPSVSQRQSGKMLNFAKRCERSAIAGRAAVPRARRSSGGPRNKG